MPNPTHYSDDIFRSNNLTELTSLDKILGGSESSKKLTVRLARNLEKRSKFLNTRLRELDNRAGVRHEAIFLPGPTCTNTEVWLQLRQKPVSMDTHLLMYKSGQNRQVAGDAVSEKHGSFRQRIGQPCARGWGSRTNSQQTSTHRLMD